MLPRENRLIKRKDFEEAHRKGKFFYSGNIAMRVLENELSLSRIGFSVGIKFSKKAVERNKIKRQLRDIFHKHLAEIRSGVDIIVMIKKEEKQAIDWKKLNFNVENALRKAKLINNKK